MRKPSRRPVLALLALGAAFLVACSGAGAPSATAGPALTDATRGGVAFGPNIAVPAPAEAGRSTVAATDPKSQILPVPQAFEPDRALILTASVAMKAKDPWSVSDQVQRIALGLGGDVLSLR